MLNIPQSEKYTQQNFTNYIKNVVSFDQKTHNLLSLFNTKELSPHFYTADIEKYKSKLNTCGKSSLEYDVGNVKYLIPITCKDRFCEKCAKKRSNRVQNQLDSLLTDLRLHTKQKQLRFLTLTVKNVPKSDICNSYDKLIKAFQNLKRSTIWKNNVKGAMQSFETTISKDNEYHPHIHILYQGDYIPQSSILQTWSKIVNRLGLKSSVVDIRIVTNIKKAIREIGKYCFKPSDFGIMDKYRLNKALYRRNLYGFSGEWYKHLKEVARNNMSEIDPEYPVLSDIVKLGYFRGVRHTPTHDKTFTKHEKYNLFYRDLRIEEYITKYKGAHVNDRFLRNTS